MKHLMILLGMAAMLTLPATWTTVQAQGTVEIRNFSGGVHPITKTVRLIWWASEDTALIGFTVEHSLDGHEFTPIGDVPAVFTGEEGHIYDFWHDTPVPGVNFYRLNLVFTHGGVQMSDITKVAYNVAPIYSYPTYPANPRPDIITPLTDGSDHPDWSEAIITDIYGRPVMSVRNHSDLDLTRLPVGIYILSARHAEGWKASMFVVNKD